jgi:hypothetical protein
MRTSVCAPEAWRLRCPTGCRSVSYREQSRSAEAAHQRRELPTEIAGIANASVHAIASRRNVLMRRIAREKHASFSIGLSHQQVWGPWIGNQDFAGDGPTHKSSEQRVGIDMIQIIAGLGTRVQRPVIDVVLRNQRSAGRLVVPSDAPALQHVAC